ncbi:metacaspase-1-like [Oxyura jamaicensis]|uniref:metacaspase-1-like n=1 Tax=Oxyura jamaicensis TaxID=8884 RepID=UPI0015A501F7|nr:metacaspase-1-like [Oxyura jamaicensis]
MMEQRSRMLRHVGLARQARPGPPPPQRRGGGGGGGRGRPPAGPQPHQRAAHARGRAAERGHGAALGGGAPGAARPAGPAPRLDPPP